MRHRFNVVRPICLRPRRRNIVLSLLTQITITQFSIWSHTHTQSSYTIALNLTTLWELLEAPTDALFLEPLLSVSTLSMLFFWDPLVTPRGTNWCSLSGAPALCTLS